MHTDPVKWDKFLTKENKGDEEGAPEKRKFYKEDAEGTEKRGTLTTKDTKDTNSFNRRERKGRKENKR